MYVLSLDTIYDYRHFISFLVVPSYALGNSNVKQNNHH